MTKQGKRLSVIRREKRRAARKVAMGKQRKIRLKRAELDKAIVKGLRQEIVSVHNYINDTRNEFSAVIAAVIKACDVEDKVRSLLNVPAPPSEPKEAAESSAETETALTAAPEATTEPANPEATGEAVAP